MRQQLIYFGVNKDRSVRLFVDEPHRDGDHWIGKYYLNSVVQKQLEDAIAASDITWESDSQCIQINIPGDNEEHVNE